MSAGVKYYTLESDEEMPEEFCAVRTEGGEPDTYAFYLPYDAVDELVEENAKLRKLVKDVQGFHECGRDCTECPLFDQCNEESLTNGCIGIAIIRDRMRALGIEVD